MSSSCDQPQATPHSSKTSLTIALAGNPNSGKTTIFNALTGLRQKVANYPGVTVEKKTGRCHLPDGRWAEIIDLPGTYSLISRSPDELVAMEVLRGIREGIAEPDLVIVVVDASNLQRNLYLVSQLIELGRPMIVALNMMDVAERRGVHVSPEGLARELGVAVVPIVGHRREGIEDLKSQISNARVAPLPDFPVPAEMKKELMAVGAGLAEIDSAVSPLPPGEGRGEGVSENRKVSDPPRPLTLTLSQGERGQKAGAIRSWICREDDAIRRLDRYQALAERLLIGDRAADIEHLATHDRVSSLLGQSTERLKRLGIDPMHADVEAHYRWIESVVARSAATLEELASMGAPAPTTLEYQAKKVYLSEKVDRIFMHWFWGFAVFGAIMGVLFVSIFWLADPIMGMVEGAVAWLGGFVSPLLPEGPIQDLWNDGIVAGVGGVVVFVPQIAILFMFIAILEDSGYLARAAFLMDRALAKVGLHGKSFIPMLSSFACAIPGIMATRTIENRKDRLATIFVAPFMSCSARLPVYALLIGAFFGAYHWLVQGGIMFSMYVIGVLAAAGTAWVFKRSFLKGPTPAFILEMPTYKVPQLSQVVRAVIVNTGAFLKKAGTIIFCLSVILWALTYYPRLPDADQLKTNAIEALRLDHQRAVDGGTAAGTTFLLASEQEAEIDSRIASEQLRYSLAGRFGHLIEPAIKPLGYDWKMGVGLVGAFAAREVFVSTMGIVYSAGESEDDTTSLEQAMLADTYADGRPVWTPLVAISLLVWFVLAMQCMSTLAIVRRETGGWKWPIGMLVYMNGLAYVVCLVIYQVGRVWFV